MKYYLRIITSDISNDTVEHVKVFLDKFCATIEAKCYSIIEYLKPYYKIEGYGIMTFEFNTIMSLERIKNTLGIGWDNDIIDSSRGTIYCKDIAFLWLHN